MPYCAKTKILKFDTKNVLLGIFRLNKNWKKTIVILGISTLEFAEMQKIVQSKQKSIFGPAVPSLDILSCKFEKVLSYFEHPRICQTAKFRAKLEILDFGTKNV